MNGKICVTAFATGLVAIAWIAVGYAGVSPLALTMTLLIGAVYLSGGLELLRFHQATATLTRALEQLPAHADALERWLADLPAGLRNPVRLRLEGERGGLPGPAVTPYLVGLLVMLGMLGTFLGMVVTLNGAVMALESTTDLHTIRAALAAPVKGLGLAFGTSVAGVAGSAMLGLVAALCRRERVAASQLLDTQIAGGLRGFSLAQQRQETYRALQLQANAMPDLVARLDAMMARIEGRAEELDRRLIAGQERFHADVQGVHLELARSVDRSLRESLGEGARIAGATLQPAVEATMAGIARETTALQARVADGVERQLDGLAARVEATAAAVAERWSTALARQERSAEGLASSLEAALAAFATSFETRSTALLAGVDERQAAALAALAAQETQRLTQQTQALTALAESLRDQWQQAAAQGLEGQRQICATLEQTAGELNARGEAQAARTIAEVTRLMQVAAEAPRAAAEVIGELRRELSASMARDTEALDERARVMATLAALLDTIRLAAGEQRGAIDALVLAAREMLERAGGEFAARVAAGSGQIAEVATRVTTEVRAGAIEVASLGEAFGLALQSFADGNDKLAGSLQRIEAALDKSLARSDEQLAYYVAQAREIIDLSVMSQKRVVEELQGLAARPAALAGEVC